MRTSAACLLALATLTTAHADPPPVTAAAVDGKRRAELARAVADSRRAGPPRELTRSQLREPMHAFVPLLRDCYARAVAHDPALAGVVNTKLAIASVRNQGTIFTVRGFDTSGALGQSSEFRACVTATAATIVLPPIADGGAADVTYPITFAPDPPDNHDTGLVDRAAAAAAAGHWEEALASAERGLELTSLDGTFRRKLIATAGVAACHLGREAKARHYYALASAAFTLEIADACRREAHLDVTR
jgi:hypothetical protein